MQKSQRKRDHKERSHQTNIMGKKVFLKLIEDDVARKASFKKRRNGLEKKVRELSTLCGVSASLIIFGLNDPEPTTWPSHSEVQENLARLFNIDEMDRNKKMLDQEAYLKDKVNKMEEQLERLRKKNRGTEISDLMHVYQGNGVDYLTVNDVHALIWFAREKRVEIKKRLEFLQQTPPLSLDAFHELASPLSAAYILSQAQELVGLDQVAPKVGDNNVDGSNYEQSPQESNLWEQWFADLVMDSNNNMIGTSSMVKTNDMTGLNAPHQPFGASSGGGSQLGFVGFRNYNEPHSGDFGYGNLMDLVDNRNFPSYMGGFDDTETNMRLQSYEDFEGLMNNRGMSVPLVQMQPPPYNDKSHFTSGMQVDEGFIGIDEFFTGKNVSIAQLPSHFEGNNSGNGAAMGMQPLQNAGASSSGNATGSDMGLSSEFLRGNATTNAIGLSYDMIKQWHDSFYR